MDDYDCELDHYCGYELVTDISDGRRTCLELFSKELGHQFGADTVSASSEVNILHNGQHCMSGFARVSGSTATCVEITEIKTNKDSFKSVQEEPA